MIKVCALGIVGSAGLAMASSSPAFTVPSDIKIDRDTGLYIEPEGMTADEELAGHYYLNVATGELIFNRFQPATSPIRGASTEVWMADNRLPCADFGQTSGTSGLIDRIGGGNDWDTGSMILHWGDIPADTVIDAVQVRYSTRHIDVIVDGSPAGVEGFGAEWTWNDGDNGRNSCLTRTPLVGLTLFNLPGRTTVPPGTALSVYIFTVDMADAGISFEIGDSDGDPQGADVHNPFFFITDTSGDGFPDGDLDGDGLADFSYTQRFFQPGTVDWNGDGNLDGDINAWADAGNSLVAPTGTAVPIPDHPTNRWTIDPVDPLPAGQGIEDSFDRYYFPFGDDFSVFVGSFFYSGFSCDANGDGTFARRSYAQFWHVMLGPDGAPQPCPADFNGDGLVNFFDVSAFIAAFNNQDPAADINGDGLWNFFDVSAFITLFNAGCP
ncbi:MAG: hypothetical protein LAT64_12615 [Phycisphaerales bacterium]|nr:hypothetical protein [Planctomycetota bacterium]MCH8509597.1 hypothetical protein [Phycisphaerales bacterium]